MASEHIKMDMPVIGLVGGIGSGKSTVAGILCDLGCEVINADRVGHELLAEDKVKGLLHDAFGKGIFDEADKVDRLSLGKIVFSDNSQLEKLNNIVHPLMRERFIEKIGRLREKSAARAIILDAAVLFEAGWDDLCDACVFVASDEAARLERVRKERNWSESEWQNREMSQISLDKKAQQCCYSLKNNSSITHLGRQVASLLNQITHT